MHDAVVGRVSIARCAELLTAAGDTIERSALSRYCDAHGLKVGRQGRATLVDFEAVREHRSSNYTREVMSGQASAESPRPVATVTPLPTRDDPQRGLKEVQLRNALRDEAERDGLLTPTGEVDAGAADAIAAMRAAFAQAASEAADKLAADLHLPADQVRTIRSHMKRFARVGQERFAQVVSATIADANEPTAEAYARLSILTAHAIRLRARPQAIDAAARA